MIQRYYISKMVGDGSENDPKRPKIAEYGVNFSITHSNGYNWCFGVTDVSDINSLVGDTDIIIFPGLSLETPVFDVVESVRNTMFLQVQAFTGLELTELLPTTTFKRVIEYLGAIQSESFNFEKFRVG